MPELPEVETIVNDLQLELTGRRLVELLKADKTITGPAGAWRRLKGEKILRIWRRGKQIIIDLSGGRHIVIHLKMTGQLIWLPVNRRRLIVGGHPIIGVGETLPNKFTRVIWRLTGGTLFFNDVRKFGWWRLLSTAELLTSHNLLGDEPLTKQFSGSVLAARLAKKSRSAIKSALLDQTKVAGIGNIYADEALFLSKIKPTRLVGAISQAEWNDLAKNIKRVLRLSIKHRGTSFSDYRDAAGQVGNFINKLQVYGRTQAPCRVCQAPVKKMKLGGRGTHWCEICQK